MASLSKIIQLLMQKHHMTTTELAEKSGLPTVLILRLRQEAGLDPRISTAQKLAIAFGLTLSQLVGEEPLPPTTSSRIIDND